MYFVSQIQYFYQNQFISLLTEKETISDKVSQSSFWLHLILSNKAKAPQPGIQGLHRTDWLPPPRCLSHTVFSRHNGLFSTLGSLAWTFSLLCFFASCFLFIIPNYPAQINNKSLCVPIQLDISSYHINCSHVCLPISHCPTPLEQQSFRIHFCIPSIEYLAYSDLHEHSKVSELNCLNMNYMLLL